MRMHILDERQAVADTCARSTQEGERVSPYPGDVRSRLRRVFPSLRSVSGWPSAAITNTLVHYEPKFVSIFAPERPGRVDGQDWDEDRGALRHSVNATVSTHRTRATQPSGGLPDRAVNCAIDVRERGADRYGIVLRRDAHGGSNGWMQAESLAYDHVEVGQSYQFVHGRAFGRDG